MIDCGVGLVFVFDFEYGWVDEIFFDDVGYIFVECCGEE